jgi:short-subunit dehydrogenase
MNIIVGGSKGLGKYLVNEYISRNIKIISFARSYSKKKIISNNLRNVKFDINNFYFKDLDYLIPKNSIDSIFMTVGLFYDDDDIYNVEKKNNELINTNALSIVKIINFLIKKNKFKNKSSINFFSSVSTFFPRNKNIMYTASKSFLNSYANSLRIFMQQTNKNISVNNFILGILDKPLSGVSYDYKIKGFSKKKLAKLICKKSLSSNKNIIIPRYWILFNILLNILPNKLILILIKILQK